MSEGKIDINDPKFWEEILANEGMPADLGAEKNGRQIDLGDGLGGKTEQEEDLEDAGAGHSSMCPINLHHALDGSINQPTDNPLESNAIFAEETEEHAATDSIKF